MPLSDIEFDALYRAHRRLVRNYFGRRVGDADLCDDLCADVFELAYRKLPSDHANPAGWLIKTASHVLKSSGRARRREQLAMRDHIVVSGGADGDVRQDALEVAWSRLSERHREVLQLLFWEQLSGSEIAVVLGCSEQAVWKRASRARAELRAVWPHPERDTEGEVNDDLRVPRA